ncbi:MAG: hypothetical protein SRB1_00861 [Desulfobacteraceae bacterium Eth-SRB1]|nr:MAG: hypothetical protein SRB1_00861 [Desulfobacteraceae bacterium Eth-SRB1]
MGNGYNLDLLITGGFLLTMSDSMEVVENPVIGISVTKVSHNPGSSMKLGAGVAPVPAMLKQGVIVGLGTEPIFFILNEPMLKMNIILELLKIQTERFQYIIKRLF